MQNILKITTFTHLIIIYFLSLALPSPSQATFGRTIKDEATQDLGLDFKKEKVSHLRFYWHDILSGPRPTSVTILNPSKKSRTGFGTVNMIDNPLTEGPKLSSKVVGRAQGFYALDSQQKDAELFMAMNFVFMERKYNESSFTVLGQNVILNKVREMPVIGGSGLFRFARGYVQARTYTFNPKSIDVTVQYDCYVMHY